MLLFRKPLQFEDMWKLPPQDRVANLAKRFEDIWGKEQQKAKPSLVWIFHSPVWVVCTEGTQSQHGLCLRCCLRSAPLECHLCLSQVDGECSGQHQCRDGAYVACGRCVMTQQLRHVSTCVQTLAIWKVSWHLFLGALPFKLVNDAATFVGPLFLNLLLGVVSAGKSSTLGYSYAALMFVGLVIGTLCDNQHFQRVMRAGTVPTPPMLPIIF